MRSDRELHGDFLQGGAESGAARVVRTVSSILRAFCDKAPSEAPDQARPTFAIAPLRERCPDPSAVMAARQQHLLLVEALRSIPMDAPLALDHGEGRSAAEVGVGLDLPLGTLKPRIARNRGFHRPDGPQA